MKHVEIDLDDTFAVLSDVHSNYPALDAVLDDIPDHVTDYVFLGDIVGYAAEPQRCLERVRDVADVILMGNHDRSVHTPELYNHNHMARAGLEHANEQLTDNQIDWVTSLPERVIVNDELLFAHSHPDPGRNDRYMHPHKFADLIPYFNTYDVDVIALGHTHVPHTMDAAAYADEHTKGGLALNPGSVGQPRDNDPRAAYAIVTTNPSLDVTLHRVEYDVHTAQQRIRDAGLPDDTATRLNP